MSLFLLTIFSMYSAVHIYAFFKMKAAFPFGAHASIFLGFFLAVMAFSPILVRILERYGYECSARLMAYIGYSWMGIVFLFFTFSFLTDLYHLLIYGTGLTFSQKYRPAHTLCKNNFSRHPLSCLGHRPLWILRSNEHSP